MSFSIILYEIILVITAKKLIRVATITHAFSMIYNHIRNDAHHRNIA
ncbi:MAG: hypothetical protein U9Q66_01405 [Patescibacteria group bacterium]|nr:hypothetical protein [Patescibacteria group bacterium]